MFNNQQIENNWPSIKTQVLNKWNKLSEADVEKTHGTPSSLSKLVHHKYGNNEEFDKTYEKICNSCFHSSKNPNLHKQADGVANSEHAETQDFMHTNDSPERRMNANYAKVEHNPNINREADDELSAYTATFSRSSLDQDLEEFSKNENNESNTQFTSPDEFSPSHNPSLDGADIPLGRNFSSATNQSTAKAAPKSSEVSSNDAKK